MLSFEDNERLVRVGPGKPAGEMFRRYWQPAFLAEELPDNDGAPLRVRLLGEDLIAFRDTLGRIGLVDAYCPHRRAPLFFGRNEECGLRCVYHGWKFDIEGACVDMPSEPADSTFKDKVRLASYPTVERGGLIWAYLGPKDRMPAPPDYEWLRAPTSHRFVSKVMEHCNYLQGLEGGLDSSHSSFLHNNRLGDRSHLRNRDGAPRIEVETTDCGFLSIATRRVDDEKNYVRTYHYILPTHQVRSGVVSRTGERLDVPMFHGHIWVPIDDENSWIYNWHCAYDRGVPFTAAVAEAYEAKDGRAREDFVSGTFELKQNMANDYLIDRQVQKTQTYTGIKGVNTQDFAVQEGMGPIVDRSKEHLGTSDRGVIAMRRLLLEAVAAVERGDRPRGADAASYRSVRPHDAVIAADADWRQAFGAELKAKW